MTTMDDIEFKKRLSELKLFTLTPTWLGVPRKLAAPVIGLSIGLAAVTAWWIGALVFVVFFAPLYRAHQTDPRAADVWLDTAFRQRRDGIDPTHTRHLPLEIRP